MNRTLLWIVLAVLVLGAAATTALYLPSGPADDGAANFDPHAP